MENEITIDVLQDGDCLYEKKKTLWPLFMDGVQPPQG